MLAVDYLLLEYGQPVDVAKPAVVFDVVDAVEEVAIATREVLLYHAIQQVAQVTREELGKLELPHNARARSYTTK